MHVTASTGRQFKRPQPMPTRFAATLSAAVGQGCPSVGGQLTNARPANRRTLAFPAPASRWCASRCEVPLASSSSIVRMHKTGLLAHTGATQASHVFQPCRHAYAKCCNLTLRSSRHAPACGLRVRLNSNVGRHSMHRRAEFSGTRFVRRRPTRRQSQRPKTIAAAVFLFGRRARMDEKYEGKHRARSLECLPSAAATGHPSCGGWRTTVLHEPRSTCFPRPLGASSPQWGQTLPTGPASARMAVPSGLLFRPPSEWSFCHT
jgi:hypothetical protein